MNDLILDEDFDDMLDEFWFELIYIISFLFIFT